MKPHPRIRKTIKWGGVAVTVLLVVVWICSAWWHVLWSPARGTTYLVEHGKAYLIVSSGALQQNAYPPRLMRNVIWLVDVPYPSIDTRWGLGWRRSHLSDAVAIGLWVPVSILGLATGIAWRLDTLARHRDRAHLCPECGYDRTGLLIGGLCPECGAVPASV